MSKDASAAPAASMLRAKRFETLESPVCGAALPLLELPVLFVFGSSTEPVAGMLSVFKTLPQMVQVYVFSPFSVSVAG